MYETRLAAQEGVCAICKRLNVNGKELNVDHCHVTKIFRGLLCDRCNLVLGLIYDDVETLYAAIAYLMDARAAALPEESDDV